MVTHKTARIRGASETVAHAVDSVEDAVPSDSTMTSELTTQIEASLDQSPDELSESLPELLDEIEGNVRELVEEEPDLFADVVGRMDDLDVAEFVNENPETADQFQELLWTGAEVIAEREASVQEAIEVDVAVNFEADDCEMTGHIVVDADEETVTGGAGHIDDADLEISGSAETLVALLTGETDPVQGFMSGEFELEGPVPLGTQLAPVLSELAENVSN